MTAAAIHTYSPDSPASPDSTASPDSPASPGSTASAAAQSASVDELVTANLALVGHIVRELMNRLPSHVSRDELVSAGMLALVTSARSYDAARGVPFNRFAAIRIRGALTDELRGMDWASRAVRTKAREIDSVRNTLAAQLSRVPTRDEIAQAIGVAPSEIDSVAADVHRASLFSLQSLTPDQSEELVPTTSEGPESLLLYREQIGLLRDAVAELPHRLRTVVEEYFLMQRKMSDIAADLGVTESRVSQLRSEALALLRAGMRNDEDGTSAAAGRSQSGRRRAQMEDAYHAAVATRSSLAQRLQATTVLGDMAEPVATPLASACDAS